MNEKLCIDYIIEFYTLPLTVDPIVEMAHHHRARYAEVWLDDHAPGWRVF